MTADTDRERLAELRREFGQYAGKGALFRDTGDVYIMRRIAREIEALARKIDTSTERVRFEVSAEMEPK
jgi:hypothetical protein